MHTVRGKFRAILENPRQWDDGLRSRQETTDLLSSTNQKIDVNIGGLTIVYGLKNVIGMQTGTVACGFEWWQTRSGICATKVCQEFLTQVAIAFFFPTKKKKCNGAYSAAATQRPRQVETFKW